MTIHYDNKTIKWNSNRAITIGTFDGIHLGHKKIISKFQNEANTNNLSTLLITFDQPPKAFFSKNYFPVLTPLDEKIELLKEFDFEEVLIMQFNEKISNCDPESFIHTLLEQFGFKIYVVGENHTFGHKAEGNVKTLLNFSNWRSTNGKPSFEVVVVEQECVADTIISSTLIRNKMLTDNIEEINKLLGYEYNISGIVMLGNQLGRTIGFPTANISISENKLLPKKGVYLCDVNVKNKQFTGLANIGTKPTIDSYDQPKISIEVHIFNFSDDIYGEKISINLKKYIREERKFNALQELKEQIRLDIQSIQLSSVSSMLHQ